MASLYEPDAVIDPGDRRLVRGREAIRSFFAALVATGRKFDFGDQRPPLIKGDLALNSTRSSNGSLSAEVARQQSDGTWLWTIDRFAVT